MSVALDSLSLLLRSQRETEQMRLNNALRELEYADRQREREYQMAGTQLNLASAVNTQLMQSTASDFMSSTGLLNWYNPTTDADERSSSIEEFKEVLVAKRRPDGKGGYGFTESEASRIIGAVWAYGQDANNVRPIIKIAHELNTIMNDPSSIKIDKKTNQPYIDSNFYAGFAMTPIFQDIESTKLLLGGASKSLQNERNLQKELFQYAAGDTEIQSDIGAYELPDVTAYSSEADNLRDNILESFNRMEAGNELDQLSIELENKEDAEDQIGNIEDQIRSDKRKLDSMEQIGSILGVNENQILELSKSIQEKESRLDELEAQRDISEYNADIQYSLYHLKQVAQPDMEEYPEYGYSNEQIDKMLDYLEETISSEKTGRRMNRREQMQAGKYVGL